MTTQGAILLSAAVAVSYWGLWGVYNFPVVTFNYRIHIVHATIADFDRCPVENFA